MSWIIDPKDEHPLWRRYMDKLNTLPLNEQSRWMKEIKLPTSFLFPIGKQHATLSQDEFLHRLKTDSTFDEMWGDGVSYWGEM